jgi:hypothetical protein
MDTYLYPESTLNFNITSMALGGGAGGDWLVIGQNQKFNAGGLTAGIIQTQSYPGTQAQYKSTGVGGNIANPNVTFSTAGGGTELDDRRDGYFNFSFTDGSSFSSGSPVTNGSAVGNNLAAAQQLSSGSNSPKVDLILPTGSGEIRLWANHSAGGSGNLTAVFSGDGGSVTVPLPSNAANQQYDIVLDYTITSPQTLKIDPAVVSGTTGLQAIAVALPEPSMIGALGFAGMLMSRRLNRRSF